MASTHKAKMAPRWHTLDGRIILISRLPKRHLINIIVLLRSQVTSRLYADNYRLYDAIAKRAYQLGVTKYRSPYHLFIDKEPALEEIPFEYKWKNTATCRHCRDTLISKHRYDFVTCGCGKISIDGGNDYMKRSGYPEDFV